MVVLQSEKLEQSDVEQKSDFLFILCIQTSRTIHFVKDSQQLHKSPTAERKELVEHAQRRNTENVFYTPPIIKRTKEREQRKAGNIELGY